jgi:hypothetical protein
MPALSGTLSALLVLPATIASVIVAAGILFDRPRLYLCAVAAAIGCAVILRSSPEALIAPVGPVQSPPSAGGVWLSSLAFALGLAGVVDIMLSAPVPLFRHLRRKGRRALRPWTWGSAQEIAEQAGVPAFVPELLGVAIEAHPITTEQRLTNARTMATVLCGSLLGSFILLPSFGAAFRDAFAVPHLLANLVMTGLITFFLEPLHQEILRVIGAAHDPHPAPAGARGRLWTSIVVFLLLSLVEAINNAVETQISDTKAYEWVLLLELCALPLVVTTYYFVAALHRSELGAQRWDRALEASVFAGTIALLPFVLPFVLVRVIPEDLREALLATITTLPHPGTFGMLVVGVASVYATALVGIAIAALASAVTYGVYAVSLGVAMLDATPSTARRRTFFAIIAASVAAQSVASAFIWWFALDIAFGWYFQVLMGLFWATALYLSRFHEHMQPASSGS